MLSGHPWARLLAAALLLAAACCTAMVADPAVTRIESGVVKGQVTEGGQVIEFLGIPYARPPVGEGRFANPRPPVPWGGNMLNANKFGPGCPQNCTLMKLACPPTTSEDCLYINVWMPSSASRHKVVARDVPAHADASANANGVRERPIRKAPVHYTDAQEQRRHEAQAQEATNAGKPKTYTGALKAFEDSFVPINLMQSTATTGAAAATASATATATGAATSGPPSHATSAGLPVFVFVHGGMFMLGHSATPILNGATMAAKGVVVVTFNYRLGALGFLSAGADVPGNFGFEDQVFALKWVQRNIHAFGGDPRRVTLGGQSAGAVSVAMHMTSPGSEGLFSQAVLESPLLGLPVLTQEQASYEMGRDFVERVGCELEAANATAAGAAAGSPLLRCLRNATVDDLLGAQTGATGQLQMARKLFGSPYFAALTVPWTPVIGGPIAGQPLSIFQRGENTKVPVIAGFTKDEFASFMPVFIPELGAYSYDALIYAYFGLRVSGKILQKYPAADGVQDQRAVLAEVVRDMFIACPLRQLTRDRQFSAFLYRFDHVLSDPRLWQEYQEYCAHYACHSSEVAIVFHGKDAVVKTVSDGGSLTPGELTSAEALHQYWVNFISTGNPNTATSYPWPRTVGQGPYLRVEAPFELLSSGVNQTDRCDLWDEIGYFW